MTPEQYLQSLKDKISPEQESAAVQPAERTAQAEKQAKQESAIAQPSVIRFNEREPGKFSSSARLTPSPQDQPQQPSLWESVVKPVGSLLANWGGSALDLLSSASHEYGNARAGYVNYDPEEGELHKKQNEALAVNLTDKMRRKGEEWASESRPYGGEKGFIELLQNGEIGNAVQLGLATTMESLPRSVLASNPVGIGLMFLLDARTNYANYRDSNLPEWKKASLAIGKSFFEQLSEKVGGNPVRWFKSGTKNLAGKEIISELEKGLGKGIKNRLLAQLKKAGKATKYLALGAMEEGNEEVLSDLATDAYASILDAIDSNGEGEGLDRQFEAYLQENPKGSVEDFVKEKAMSYLNDWIGGAVAGSMMSGGTQAAVSVSNRINGKNVETPSSQQEREKLMKTIRKMVEDGYGASEEEVAQKIYDLNQKASRNEGMTDEEMQFTQEMNSKLSEAENESAAEARVEEKINQTTGTVQTVKMSDGTEANVIKGNVVAAEDGTIDRDASDPIVYVRSEDGRVVPISTRNDNGDSITDIIEELDAEDAVEDEMLLDEVETTPDFEVGQAVASGAQGTILVTAVNPDGTYNVQTQDAEGNITDQQMGVSKMELLVARNAIDTISGEVSTMEEASMPTEAPRLTDAAQFANGLNIAKNNPPETWKQLFMEQMGLTPEQADEVYNDIATNASEYGINMQQETAEEAELRQIQELEVADNQYEDADLQATINGLTERINTLSREASQAIDLENQAQVDNRQRAREELASLQEKMKNYNAIQGRKRDRRLAAEQMAWGGLEEGSREAIQSEEQRTLLDTVGKQLGVKIRVEDRKGQRGAYNPNTKTITLSSKTANSPEQVVQTVFGHELTHSLKQAVAPEVWEAFRDTVTKAMGEEAFSEALEAKRENYNKQFARMREEDPERYGSLKDLTDEEIADEVISDFAGDKIFTDQEFIQGLVDSIAQKGGDPKSFIDWVMEKLQALMERLTGTESATALENAKQLWQGMYEYASAKEEEKNNPVTKTIEAVENGAVVCPVDIGESQEQFSLATYNDWTDSKGNAHEGTRTKTERALRKRMGEGVAEKDIQQFMDNMDYWYEFCKAISNFTNPDGSFRFREFHEWNEQTPKYKEVGGKLEKALSTLVNNGEYPINVELSTDCIKREALTAMFNAIAERGGGAFSSMNPKEIEKIKQMMQNYGVQVACPLCFVEGKRLSIRNWAQTIVDDWNRALVTALGMNEIGIESYNDKDANGKKKVRERPKDMEALKNAVGSFNFYKGNGVDVVPEETMADEGARSPEEMEQLRVVNQVWNALTDRAGVQKEDMQDLLDNAADYNQRLLEFEVAWNESHPDTPFTPDQLTSEQLEELDNIANEGKNKVFDKMVAAIKKYPELRHTLDLNDLIGSTGITAIRESDGEAAQRLYSLILSRFGTATPKVVQEANPYDGDINDLSDKAFDKANKIGGARLFSFSDFDLTKVFDIMQIFWDCSARNVKLQSYSKEVGYILLFGRTGAKINMSMLPEVRPTAEMLERYKKSSGKAKKEALEAIKENAGLEMGKDGKIKGFQWSSSHSIREEFAKWIFHNQDYNADCGAIAVGVSVNHSIWLCLTDYVRQVIPFHLSGMPLASRAQNDVMWYRDATKDQNTGIASDSNTSAKTDGKFSAIGSKATKDAYGTLEDFNFYEGEENPDWDMRQRCAEYIAWCEKGLTSPKTGEHLRVRPRFYWGINADSYIQWCDNNGYEPLQEIVDAMRTHTRNYEIDGRRYAIFDGYYKMLADFNTYKPVFNEQGEMVSEESAPHKPVDASRITRDEKIVDTAFGVDESMLANRERSIQNENRYEQEMAQNAVNYLLSDRGKKAEEELLSHGTGERFENESDSDLALSRLADEQEQFSLEEGDAVGRPFIPSSPDLTMSELLDEVITHSAARVSGIRAEKARTKQLEKLDAIRRAYGVQKEFDREGARTLAKFVNTMLHQGVFGKSANAHEVTRLISRIANATGRQDISDAANALYDIAQDRIARLSKMSIANSLKQSALKQNASGVTVIGAIGKRAATAVRAFKESFNTRMTADDYSERIDELTTQMDTGATEQEREDAKDALMGVMLSQQYDERLTSLDKQIQQLKKDLDKLSEDGPIRSDSKKQLATSIEDNIRQLKEDRNILLNELSVALNEIVETGRFERETFIRDEIAQKKEMAHRVNSDLEGVPYTGMKAHIRKPNQLLTFFASPLQSLNSLLKQIGRKSTNGRGYLYEYFIPRLVKAQGNSYKGTSEQRKVLDEKAQEIFGMDYADVMDKISHEKTDIELEFYNGDMAEKHVLTKGNALYVYMVNKMIDGAMKLRRMGITDLQVNEIKEKLDPKLIQMADYLQEEFLPQLRNRYNKTHIELFGMPMASIKNYVPLRIFQGAINREVDVDNKNVDNSMSSTITGALINRVVNTKPIDIISTDALDLMLQHVSEMERWNAYAGVIKDMNTLLSNRSFRDRLENMGGIYGSGADFFQRFRDAAMIAVGTYKPNKSKVDNAAVALGKAATAAKINFRLYTALKQTLSLPSFLTEASPKFYLAFSKNVMNMAGTFKWAMENLPTLEERFKGRFSGEVVMYMNSGKWEIGGLVDKLSKIGMAPNAFVDALTCSIGAKSVYDDKLDYYKELGIPAEEAEERAKIDAEIAYNETQQSNIGAFLAPLQRDRTIASVAISVFNNSSFGYQRRLAESISSLWRYAKGEKEVMLDYATTQLERSGANPEVAEKIARRNYRRNLISAFLNVGMFGYIIQAVWRMGAYMPYLFFGDDDDKKDEMVSDALGWGAFSGPVRGLPFGATLESSLDAIGNGKIPELNSFQYPVASDISNLTRKINTMLKDEDAKLMDYSLVMFNALTTILGGVDITLFTEITNAFLDEYESDTDKAKMALLRLLSVPKSQQEQIMIDLLEKHNISKKDYYRFREQQELLYSDKKFTPTQKDRYGKRMTKFKNERKELRKQNRKKEKEK